MRLAVVSHKPCWASPGSPSGFATDGGFPLQMRALAELFDETVLLVPCARAAPPGGETALAGEGLRVAPLTRLPGRGLARKALFPLWLLRNLPRLLREVARADAVHAPIPGDAGTAGMIAAALLRKPLFVRHCGNWERRRSAAERFWRWYMERFAGGRNVMFATGGGEAPPSGRNASIGWIFSTSLTAGDLTRLEGAAPEPAPGAPRLILVSRMEPGKGAETAIDALALLCRRFPGATLDLVGDGGALPSLRERARASGVAERVVFHGKVPHARVLELLRGAHLFCFPTRSEGFPKAVLEALAAGLPVVTSRVSVLPRLLEGGGGVALGDPTPESLADAVAECVSDPARYRAMSERARATARRFTLERWRDEIGAALRRAWGRPLKA